MCRKEDTYSKTKLWVLRCHTADTQFLELAASQGDFYVHYFNGCHNNLINVQARYHHFIERESNLGKKYYGENGL